MLADASRRCNHFIFQVSFASNDSAGSLAVTLHQAFLKEGNSASSQVFFLSDLVLVSVDQSDFGLVITRNIFYASFFGYYNTNAENVSNLLKVYVRRTKKSRGGGVKPQKKIWCCKGIAVKEEQDFKGYCRLRRC